MFHAIFSYFNLKSFFGHPKVISFVASELTKQEKKKKRKFFLLGHFDYILFNFQFMCYEVTVSACYIHLPICPFSSELLYLICIIILSLYFRQVGNTRIFIFFFKFSFKRVSFNSCWLCGRIVSVWSKIKTWSSKPKRFKNNSKI